MPAWTVPLLEIDPPKHPEALTDLVPLLERLIGAFGTRPLALLLDVESVAPSERGGALFVPAGGGNRIDNPDLYDVLYVAAAPEAAVAESFGRIPMWTPETFVHGSGRPQQLVTNELPENTQVFDLNDVAALQRLGIARPAEVVTRNRARTQLWARAIFERGEHAGASWWSYYEPDWTVIGLWKRSGFTIVGVPEILNVNHSAVRNAAATIARQIVSESRESIA